MFYELHDPYSLGRKYLDNTLKGINRYYRSSDLDRATNLWWDFAIVVSDNSDGLPTSLDLREIPVQLGR